MAKGWNSTFRLMRFLLFNCKRESVFFDLVFFILTLNRILDSSASTHRYLAACHHPEDVARKHWDHPWSIGTVLSQGSGPLFRPVHSDLVHISKKYSRQWRKGLCIQGNVSHDQRECSRRSSRTWPLFNTSKFILGADILHWRYCFMDKSKGMVFFSTLIN